MEICKEILRRFGARDQEMFLGTINAGHPGGTLPLTEREANSFHHARLPENLYVADATLLPESLGNPPNRAVDFIASNEPEARKILAKYTNLPEPVAMRIAWEHWTKVEEYSKSSGQPYFELLRKEGLFQKSVDTSQLFYHE